MERRRGIPLEDDQPWNVVRNDVHAAYTASWARLAIYKSSSSIIRVCVVLGTIVRIDSNEVLS